MKRTRSKKSRDTVPLRGALEAGCAHKLLPTPSYNPATVSVRNTKKHILLLCFMCNVVGHNELAERSSDVVLKLIKFEKANFEYTAYSDAHKV
jgi:hypothetical protein